MSVDEKKTVRYPVLDEDGVFKGYREYDVPVGFDDTAQNEVSARAAAGGVDSEIEDTTIDLDHLTERLAYAAMSVKATVTDLPTPERLAVEQLVASALDMAGSLLALREATSGRLRVARRGVRLAVKDDRLNVFREEAQADLLFVAAMSDEEVLSGARSVDGGVEGLGFSKAKAFMRDDSPGVAQWIIDTCAREALERHLISQDEAYQILKI